MKIVECTFYEALEDGRIKSKFKKAVAVLAANLKLLLGLIRIIKSASTLK